MNTEVLFENKNNKLVITLNKDVSYEELKEKLQKILQSSDTLFKNVNAPIIVTGKRLYLEKAKALADCIIRNQRESGEIPTFFQVSHYMTWLNCMIYTSQILLELDGRIQKSLANKN